MPEFSFTLNSKPVVVECDARVRLLWVLRDLLGMHGPKYGCGLGVCQACTCHWNGLAINTCSVPIGDIKPGDKITTIEGLEQSDGTLHPMQQAWIDFDVAQCGYCQPGQIMTAIAKVNHAKASGAPVDDALLDTIRNVCRCGTYDRIRQAIVAAAANM